MVSVASVPYINRAGARLCHGETSKEVGFTRAKRHDRWVPALFYSPA